MNNQSKNKMTETEKPSQLYDVPRQPAEELSQLREESNLSFKEEVEVQPLSPILRPRRQMTQQIDLLGADQDYLEMPGLA